MKVKIKGLVFVGFAAAVFAQSAFAAITPNATTDPKTVTSKKYVDEKIPDTYAMTYGGTTHAAESTAGAVVLGNGYGEVKFTKLSNSSADVHTTNGQDVVVTGKAVADAMAATVNLQAEDYTEIEDIMSNDPTPVLEGHKVILNSDKITVSGSQIMSSQAVGQGLNGDETDLTTAKAVKDLIAQQGSSTTTTINSTSAAAAAGDMTVPTVKNVYNFVESNYQDKVSSSDSTALYVGKWDGDASTGDSTWKKLQADDTQNVTHYVSIAQKTGDTSTYNVNLDANTITANNNNGADITAAGAANATAAATDKLATAKAVYDFVTSQVTGAGYQPEVAANSSETNKVMIGYRSYDSAAAEGSQYGNPGWQELSGDTYISVSSNGTAASVTLGNFADATDLYGSSSTNDNKLVKAGAVRTVLSQAGESAGANNTTVYTTTINGNAQNNVFPSSQNVFEFVMDQTGGNVIPEMPSTCTTAATSGHYCALVYGNRAAAGETPDYGLQWTVMAPAN